MSKFDALGLPPGFLTDRHIRTALESETLIVPGTWDPSSIRHASYTLRVGEKIEVARANRAGADDRRDFIVQDLGSGDNFDLNPGDTAKLYSIEILDFPDNVLGFTVARGLLFFEALVPENTYVDPGFTGTLYTTITNASNRLVRLHYGDPVARLFFYHLADAVEESFRKGSSKGIKQRLESFRATRLGTIEECRQAKTQQLTSDISALSVAGNQVAELTRRQTLRLAGVGAFAAAWPILLLLANTNEWVKQTVGRIFSNISAVILSALVSLIAPRLWEKLKRI